MKQLTTVLVLLIALSFSAEAQISKRLSFGPKVGFNLGAPVPHGSDPAIDSAGGRPLIGPNIGIFFVYNFDEKWSIMVEGNYNRKATEYWARATNLHYIDEQCIPLPNGTERCAEVETVFNGNTWGKFDNWYFEIPISVRYSFSEKWHLFLGAYYASLSRSNSVVQYDGKVGASPDQTVSERDLSNEMNQDDYGMQLGFHYQYKPLLVDFRVSYGFKSIFRKDYKPISYNIQNVFAQLSVAFQFYRFHSEEVGNE